jgi:protein-S-isoprenylcysteine O-methyltransferase Ste14
VKLRHLACYDRAMTNLSKRALRGLAIMIVVMAAILFLAAGTLHYPQAWIFLAVFGAAAFAITLYLMKYDPELLRRRMRGGPTAEKEPSQKVIMWLASFGFVAILVVSGLDHRFRWSLAPASIAIAGNILVVLGYAIIFFVFRENSFASATIEVAADQKVISTGPYALVRHPMYAGGLMYFLGVPLALGSWWGLCVAIVTTPALIWRLFEEETLLAKNLPGYSAYRDKVKFRLAPFIW